MEAVQEDEERIRQLVRELPDDKRLIFFMPMNHFQFNLP